MFANINSETQSENIKCFKTETFEERHARLEAQKERARWRRSRETPEERFARLEADKIRAREKRSRETPMERAFRLESQKIRARRRRGIPRDQLETFDYMKHIINDPCSIETSFMTSSSSTSEPVVELSLAQERVPISENVNTDSYNLNWPEFTNKFCGNFISLFESQELVDVTIAANGGHIQAHKLVLSVSSQYFRDLFKINPCQHPIVILKDVDYDSLNCLLQFMYCGEVNVAADKLPTLLSIADMLQIKGLMKGNEKKLMDTPASNFPIAATESPKSSNIKIPVFKKQISTTQTKANSYPHISVPSNIDVTILQEGSQRLEQKKSKRFSNTTPSTSRECNRSPNKRARYHRQENSNENTYDLPKEETNGIDTIEIKSENINNEVDSNFELHLLPNLVKEEIIYPNDYVYENIEDGVLDTGPGYS